MGLRDFNPLHHSLTFAEPVSLPGVTDWREHIPFAFFLISVLRPERIVELGNRITLSYCAFCHAVGILELQTQCRAFIAVHDGPDNSADRAELRAFHDARYGHFSRLLQSAFINAPDDIPDHSVDLLHIDGFSNYEAVQRHFESWRPKVSQRGIVLISRIGDDARNQEVHQFWREQKPHFPHFEFTHAGGLGLLALGNAFVPELQALCALSIEEAAITRVFFQRLGQAPISDAQGNPRGRTVNEQARTIDTLRLNLALAERHRLEAEDRCRLFEQTTHTLYKQLTELTNSRAWKMVERFWRLRAKLAPIGIESVNEGGVNSQQANSDIQQGPDRPDASATDENQTTAQLPYDYQNWIDKHEPSQAHLQTERAQAAAFGYRPLISIVTPVYRTPPGILRATIQSVLQQTYDYWEMWLVVGGSADEDLLQLLSEYTERDRRVRVKMLPRNLGIAENTNEGLRLAAGEFVALLDHDDELSPPALFEYVWRLNEDRTIDVFYSDEDKLDELGARCQPFFKPDWSPEYFRGVMYVGHLLCFRRSLLDRVGWLNPHYDGVQDFEFTLRLSESTAHITHVPRILYHWRQLPGSIAKDSHAKPNISQLQCEAVNEQLARMRLPARAEIASPHHRLRIAPAPVTEPEMVSIIITHDGAPERLANCLRSIYLNSHSVNYDVTVVGSDFRLEVAGETIDSTSLKLFHFASAFSHTRANNYAALNAAGTYLLFLNSDTEIITVDWIEQLIYYAAQKDVGAVGPLFLSADRSVQHAGTVLGVSGAAAGLMHGFSQTSDGYAGSLVCAREVSVVSAACLLINNQIFHEIGGFNEHFFAQYHNVDLCLRLRAAGRRILFTPQAKLIRQQVTAQADGDNPIDYTLLLDLWQHEIERGDPYYNPNFDPLKTDYSLRFE